jgi:hypothetical protein
VSISRRKTRRKKLPTSEKLLTTDGRSRTEQFLLSLYFAFGWGKSIFCPTLISYMNPAQGQRTQGASLSEARIHRSSHVAKSWKLFSISQFIDKNSSDRDVYRGF